MVTVLFPAQEFDERTEELFSFLQVLTACVGTWEGTVLEDMPQSYVPPSI